MNKAEVIKALSDELNGDVEGEKLRETRAYNDALRFALALVSQLDEPVQVDEISGKIYLPVVCHNGHKATATYRFDEKGMDFIFESVPENEKCSCSKTGLGEGYSVAGKPYLRQQPQQGGERWMVISAFRYALGRKTYVVSECVDWLLANWNALDEGTRNLITKEITSAIERGDAGMDCDVTEWLKVAALAAAEKE